MDSSFFLHCYTCYGCGKNCDKKVMILYNHRKSKFIIIAKKKNTEASNCIGGVNYNSNTRCTISRCLLFSSLIDEILISFSSNGI